jgi:hypothetical protein
MPLPHPGKRMTMMAQADSLVLSAIYMSIHFWIASKPDVNATPWCGQRTRRNGPTRDSRSEKNTGARFGFRQFRTNIANKFADHLGV